MIKEIYYNDIFRSKLNRIEQDKEIITPMDNVRFVTKGFKQKNDPLTGSSLHGTYYSFNPDKLNRETVFDKIYYNYLWQLWKVQGEPVDVEISHPDAIILYELDCLSSLAHISSQKYANNILRLGQNIDAITRQYPNFAGKSVFDARDKNWIFYKDLDINKFAYNKLGVDMKRCNDEGITSLVHQKWNHFQSKAEDNNMKIISELPEKVLDCAVDCGIIDGELGEPLFFTPENKHITSISDRLRLHGTELDIFSMY